MFVRLIRDLIAGDTVALTAALIMLAVALALCLFWWKTARNLHREDEQRKQRRQGKKKT